MVAVFRVSFPHHENRISPVLDASFFPAAKRVVAINTSNAKTMIFFIVFSLEK
jgi:hypothetical protein